MSGLNRKDMAALSFPLSVWRKSQRKKLQMQIKLKRQNISEKLSSDEKGAGAWMSGLNRKDMAALSLWKAQSEKKKKIQIKQT